MFFSFDNKFISVLPASTALQMGVQGNDGLIQTSGAGGTIVQYATQNQDGQFFVPGMCIPFRMDFVFIFKMNLIPSLFQLKINHENVKYVCKRIEKQPENVAEKRRNT